MSEESPSDTGGTSEESETSTAEPAQDEETIEAERQERLDPDNRPDSAEVDNSDRDFDVSSGQFTDHETDDDLGPFNNPADDDGDAEA